MRDSRIETVAEKLIGGGGPAFAMRFRCTLSYWSGVGGGWPVGGTRRCTGSASGLFGGDVTWKFSGGGFGGNTLGSTRIPLPATCGWYCEADGKIWPGVTPRETLSYGWTGLRFGCVDQQTISHARYCLYLSRKTDLRRLLRWSARSWDETRACRFGDRLIRPVMVPRKS